MRKTVFPNYIPHRNVKNGFKKWFKRYKDDVIHLYDIFHRIEHERYDEKFEIPSEKDIINFGVFLYKSSSKHIQD